MPIWIGERLARLTRRIQGDWVALVLGKMR